MWKKVLTNVIYIILSSQKSTSGVFFDNYHSKRYTPVNVLSVISTYPTLFLSLTNSIPTNKFSTCLAKSMRDMGQKKLLASTLLVNTQSKNPNVSNEEAKQNPRCLNQDANNYLICFEHRASITLSLFLS